MPTARPQLLKFSFALLIALFSSVSSGIGAPPSIQVIPASPRYQEPVIARYRPGFGVCLVSSQISMVDTTIKVKYVNL